MALSPRTYIRALINEARDQFDTDDDRAIYETADTLTPVYYSEILKEWAELPADARDEWQEVGVAEDATIFTRMTTDLFWYYYNQTAELWAEIQDEHTCPTA